MTTAARSPASRCGSRRPPTYAVTGTVTYRGKPVEGASVTAKVVSQYRGPKGIAFKYKRRKGFHKTKGFRRSLTTLEVTSIAG